MKRIKTIIFFGIFILNTCFGQNWELALGETLGEDRGYKIIQTNDNGFGVIGWTGFLELDVILVKLNENGIVEWEKTITEQGDQWGWDIEELDNGDFLFSEFSESGKIRRFNSQGDEIWTNTFDNIKNGILTPETDSTFIIAGSFVSSFPVDSFEIKLLKINGEGEEIWANSIFLPSEVGGSIIVRQVITTQDAGILLSGSLLFQEVNGISHIGNTFVIKTNQLGELEWAKSYAYRPDLPEQGFKAIEKPDGSFVIFNSSYVMNLNSDGEPIWATTTAELLDFGFGENGLVDSSGDIFFVANRANSSSGIVLAKLSSTGELIWAKIFEDDVCKTGWSMVQNNQNGFTISGFIDSLFCTDKSGKILVINTDSLVSSATDFQLDQVDITDSVETIDLIDITNPIIENMDYGLVEFNMYPNPAINNCNLKLHFPQATNFEMSVFDIHGKQVFKKKYLNISSLNESIDIGSLNSGAYFVKIESSEFNMVKKFEILK